MAKQKVPQDNSALMEAIGVPNGFDPLPRRQYQWPLDQGVKGFIRFWSFLIKTTLGFHSGRDRSPFVVDEHGREMYIEEVAVRLGMDVANARKLWREAKVRGLARNGSKEEGKKRLLHLR